MKLLFHHAGGKRAKIGHKFVQTIFENMHEMLPTSLKLSKIMSWQFYYCTFLKLLFQIINFFGLVLRMSKKPILWRHRLWRHINEIGQVLQFCIHSISGKYHNLSLRWFLSIALRIPAAHDFCVISACKYTTKEISLKLSSIAK